MKTLKRITVLALALTLVLSIAACGGSSAAGTWELTSMTTDGETYSAADLKEIGFEQIFELKSGGKGSMTAFGESGDITWKESGKTVTVTIDGDDSKLTLDGKKLTLEEDGEVLVFEKK